jgi:dCMP deaminase
VSQLRPGWTAWGLELARTVALRADCTRRQVGAVIVTADHRIVATGYNGAAPGAPGCLTAGACPRGASDVAPGSSYDTGPGACIALHAEQNALLRDSWADMTGSTMYITDEPCGGCMKMLGGTPLAAVHWPDGRWTNPAAAKPPH